MDSISLQILKEYFQRKDYIILQELIERSEIQISDSEKVLICPTKKLKEHLPLLIKVLEHSLFDPDDTVDLNQHIEQIFFSNPDSTNYIILKDDQVVGISQVYKLNDVAILNVLGFLPDIRNTGYYSLINCLRFLFAYTKNCKYISGITSNPLVIKKMDEWGFYYSPTLYNKLHNVNTCSNELIKQSHVIWTQIMGEISIHDLIIRKNAIPHGKFVISRIKCNKKIIDDYVDTNLVMGDRMIIIKKINSDFAILLHSLLDDFIGKKLR